MGANAVQQVRNMIGDISAGADRADRIDLQGCPMA
jgi:hypothetical protein